MQFTLFYLTQTCPRLSAFSGLEPWSSPSPHTNFDQPELEYYQSNPLFVLKKKKTVLTSNPPASPLKEAQINEESLLEFESQPYAFGPISKLLQRIFFESSSFWSKNVMGTLKVGTTSPTSVGFGDG
ncbi:hypothetical protein D9619_006191 [Psilocybe cf. subviscida]|uniref:Uncharacterized protein n=1 Tax=Psilocybe cf. subviscida TaxID=2480587 RepID=A0A8H5B548_9AGAR|nr:hypothetical protein D9619_006191 [Psilocybe cf. subviscida]